MVLVEAYEIIHHPKGMLPKLTTWQTTVQEHPSGDGMMLMPSDVVLDNDFLTGDVFISERVAEGTLVLRHAVRLSRLRREWNKYQHRIERSGHTFVVLRNNKPVSEIGPANEDDDQTWRMRRPLNVCKWIVPDLGF